MMYIGWFWMQIVQKNKILGLLLAGALLLVVTVVSVLYMPFFSHADMNEDTNVALNISTNTYYTNLRTAASEAKTGETIEIIKENPKNTKDDNFRINVAGGISNNITIQKSESLGNVETYIDCDYDDNIVCLFAGATFKNLGFSFGVHSYHGFQTSSTINFENCKLYGLIMGYSALNFTNCNFYNETVSGEYNMWTYCGDINCNNCNFYSYGKFINVYNSGQTVNHNIIFDNCCFHNCGDKANKSAVNVKATTTSDNVNFTQLYFTVMLNKCKTENSFPKNHRLQNELVMIDDGNSNNVSIKLNDKILYPEPASIITDVSDVEQSKVLTTTLSDSSFSASEIKWTSSNESAIQLMEANDISGASVKATRVGNGFSRVVAADTFSKMTQTFYFGNPTLFFDMQDKGSQVESQIFDPRNIPNIPTKPDNPTCQNYDFVGWFTSNEFTDQFDFSKPITDDTTAYAKWEKVSDPIPPEPDPPEVPEEPLEPTEIKPISFSENTSTDSQPSVLSKTWDDTLSPILILISLAISFTTIFIGLYSNRKEYFKRY